jgi:hypothetical protein
MVESTSPETQTTRPVLPVTRPVPPVTEARVARAHVKPNPLPSRLAVGAGALAAVSVIAAGIGQLSSEPSAVLPPVEPATTTLAAAVPDSQTRVVRPIRYVKLKPGEKAPAGAKVIQQKAPAPRVVVHWVSSGSSATASSTAPQRAPIARTRQSGRP